MNKLTIKQMIDLLKKYSFDEETKFEWVGDALQIKQEDGAVFLKPNHILDPLMKLMQRIVDDQAQTDSKIIHLESMGLIVKG